MKKINRKKKKLMKKKKIELTGLTLQTKLTRQT
jgi:ribosome-associated protein YbcJ (S4-like RNA binding protein)